VRLVVAPHRRGNGFAAIHRNRYKQAASADGLGEETRGRPLVPRRCQEGINDQPWNECGGALLLRYPFIASGV